MGCSFTIIGEFISASRDSNAIWIRLFWSIGCSELRVGDWFVGWGLIFVDESEYILPFGFAVALAESSKFLFPATGP